MRTTWFTPAHRDAIAARSSGTRTGPAARVRLHPLLQLAATSR